MPHITNNIMATVNVTNGHWLLLILDVKMDAYVRLYWLVK
ncbi:MAG: hypothetical protein ACI843_001094 [Psychrobacter glaciei]|jgi:hypothetical protein